MRAERVLAQLVALRLVLDGLIVSVEEAQLEEQRNELLLPLEDTQPRPTCAHPAERQINASVMGGAAQVLCLVCGEQRPGVVPQ